MHFINLLKALGVLFCARTPTYLCFWERVVSNGRDLGSLTDHLICIFQLRSEYMQLYASKVSEGMALQLGCLELRYVLARQNIASDTTMFGKHVSRVRLLWLALWSLQNKNQNPEAGTLARRKIWGSMSSRNTNKARNLKGCNKGGIL